MVAAVSAGLGCGLVRVTTVNIGQKTSLERQLIGELEPLSEEEILAASVRAANSTGDLAADDLMQRAVAARQRQLFNRDDIDELKAAGCLGEGPRTELLWRECELGSDPEVQSRGARLVNEENADRAAVIDWVLATDPVLTPSDREQVVQIYSRLLLQNTKAGQWTKSEDGAWTQKPAKAE
jgi:hypothetical protein